MKLYCWDSFERKFTPTLSQEQIPSGERVLLESLEVEKGRRITGDAASGDMMICMLRGAWRMEIADSHLTVRDNEVVIIPRGFSHSAEAIEDSFALQIVREQDASDDYMWGV